MPNPPNLTGYIFEGSNDMQNTVGLRCLSTIQDERIVLVVNTHFSPDDLQNLPPGVRVPGRATILYKSRNDYPHALASLVRTAIGR